MRIELNSFMTAAERDKVEIVLRRASEREHKADEYGLYHDKDHACGLGMYMTWDEEGQVNAVLRKAVDRAVAGPIGGVGEHYRLCGCRCRQYLEPDTGKGEPRIGCSDYLGAGLCRGRLYIYEDELPFV